MGPLHAKKMSLIISFEHRNVTNNYDKQMNRLMLPSAVIYLRDFFTLYDIHIKTDSLNPVHPCTVANPAKDVEDALIKPFLMPEIII